MKTLAPIFLFLALLLSSCVLPTPEDLKPGAPKIQWSQYGLTKKLSQTIVVPPNTTLDGRLKDGKLTRLIAQSNLGDGGQSEGQKPLILVQPGGRVKNFILDFPAADGIHLICAPGKTTRIEDCEWRDVGEDAFTVKGTGGNARVQGCKFAYASDKCGQLNDEVKLLVQDCQVYKFERFARGCGTCGNKAYDIQLKDIQADTGTTLLKLTTKGSKGSIENAKTWNVQHLFQVENGAKITVK